MVRSKVRITSFVFIGYGTQLTDRYLALFTQNVPAGFKDKA